MGRIISDTRKAQIKWLRESDPDALGPQLGELIIEGNLPVEAIAKLLAVAEPTIYRWMYGDSYPRDHDKIVKIKNLLIRLNNARNGGFFPLNGSTVDRANVLFSLLGDGSIDTVNRPEYHQIDQELFNFLSNKSKEEQLAFAEKAYELSKRNLISGGSIDGRPITKETIAAMNHLRNVIAEFRARMGDDDD